MAANLIPNTITLGGVVQGSPDTVFGVDAGVMDNWIQPEVFSGTIDAGGSFDLNVNIDATNISAMGEFTGSLVIVPDPEIGNHSIDITLDILTAIDEPAVKSGLVFPNPAKDKLNFEIDESSSISLFNINGVCVFEKSGVSGMYQLDVKNYPAGIYFAKIITQASEKNVKIIIR